jgi:hypothetical protein
VVIANPQKRIDADRERAIQLGWETLSYPLSDGRCVLSLLNGMDRGEPVRLRIYYKVSKRTGDYLFRSALADWMRLDVQADITKQSRLWHLAETYAPKED